MTFQGRVDEEIGGQCECGEGCGLHIDSMDEVDERQRAEEPADAECGRGTDAAGGQGTIRRALHAGVGIDLHELIKHRRAEGR